LICRKNITEKRLVARNAPNASDRSTEQEWQELAALWRSMADHAAMMLGDPREFE
jgi:hypothetical protein